MLLAPVFQPFLEQRPICVMARAVLQRVLDPGHIDAVFAQTARQQYTHELLFSTLVELMSQVVLGIQPSVYASYRALADRLPVSDQAVYDKLQRVELAVSRALVRDAARRVRPVVRKLRASLPSWLPGCHVKILDGNHLEATEHRLPELRTTWAAPLPGKGLVVLDQPSMTVTDVLLAEDGQAQERSLLPEVVPLIESGDLWLADRNFCTVPFLWAIADRDAAFIIRQHGALHGELLGERKAKGRCATGRLFEQRLRVRDGQGRARVFRRVTIELDQPTQDGDTVIHLLTNLPAKKASARKVAELYRRRWTIEGLFLEVAQTLDCEIDTLCYPKAALFAFSLGLLATNAVALLKAALRAAHGRKVVQEQVSGYYLALEIRQTYAGMMVAIPAAHWAVFHRLDDAGMAAVLRDMAERVRLARYRKSVRGPKKKPPPKTRYRNGAHVATAKILAARKGKP
jgi:IS4 transposase